MKQMPNKTYICHASISIRVEAESEDQACFQAGMEMDIGDIDWEAEEIDQLIGEEGSHE